MSFKYKFINFNWNNLAAVILPFIPYFILTIPLFGWIVDDAGISFVYSRNVASGHGLVSQPGLDPVEGYSNPLWVFMFVPFFVAGVFDPFVVPKVLSFILVLVTFFLIHKSVQLLTGTKYFISIIVLLFIGTNTSFTVWTCSGLENPLFATLIASLFYATIKTDPDNIFKIKKSMVVGFIAGGIALTRPDGIIYFIVYPTAIFLVCLPLSKDKVFSWMKVVSVYSITIVVIFGSYLLFRILYFGNIYPNTYFVKGGPTLSIVKDSFTLQQTYLIKLQQLLQSAFDPHLWLIMPVTVVIWLCYAFRSRRPFWRELVLLLMMLIAAFDYLILTNDWMGEYRLATPFFVMLFALGGVAIYQISQLLGKYSKIKIGIISLFIVMLGIMTFQNQDIRLKYFTKAPTVSFASVAQRFGHRFNQYADSLGLTNASFLVPDMGGTLYYSNLRIYDLAGLCDTVIARTIQHDRPRLLDYIFEEAKPTIIHTHGWFTSVTRFDEDPRFMRDYVAIDEYEDKYAENQIKRKIMSGNYVRKGAIEKLD